MKPFLYEFAITDLDPRHGNSGLNSTPSNKTILFFMASLSFSF